MTIMGYIGHWEDGITLSPHPEDEAVFAQYDKWDVLVEGRLVVFVPIMDGMGYSGVSICRARNGGLGVQYKFGSETAQPWARFQRHEVEFDVQPDGSLYYELEADHKLPWPRFHTTGVLDLDEVVEREFKHRVQSAVKTGGEQELRDMLRSIPDKVRKYIKATIWLNTINGALADARSKC